MKTAQTSAVAVAEVVSVDIFSYLWSVKATNIVTLVLYQRQTVNDLYNWTGEASQEHVEFIIMLLSVVI